MKTFKFNTGTYNILLIELPTEEVITAELNKVEKYLIVNDEKYDLSNYIDNQTREIKILGMLSLLRERHFRSIVPIDKIFKKQWYTQKFTKKFYSLIEEEWDVDAKNTLVVRV